MSIDFELPDGNAQGALLFVLPHAAAVGSDAWREVDARTAGLLGRATAQHLSGSADAAPLLVLGLSGQGIERVVVAWADEASDALSPVVCGRALASRLSTDDAVPTHLFVDPVLLAAGAAWPARVLHGLCEVLHIASSSRRKGRNAPAAPARLRVHVPGKLLADARESHRRLAPVTGGALLARDLVMAPPNVMTPSAMAECAAGLQAHGVAVEVLEAADLRRLGMHALLAVARGSAEPPRVVTMRWSPPARAGLQPLVLVGKGVTFDSGGLALKPKAGIEVNKYDMAGAAAVIGAMRVAAMRDVRTPVTGLIGLLENMPDGAAMKPGDLIRTMSGITVEADNPDAEGRLLLADLLHHACTSLQPAAMVDLATLTGAAIHALGHEVAALFANDDDLAARIVRAAVRCGEPVWRLPLVEAYADHIHGTVADLRNQGRPGQAGAIYAALFLQRFVGKVPWAHLDIAGPAWLEEPSRLGPKRATGFGVRLLSELIDMNSEAS
jgi:leucyl aminopeptidase